MAGQRFCGEDWSKLKKKYHSFKGEDLPHYCFSSAYIVALLHDSLGISLDDERYFPGFITGQADYAPLLAHLCAFVYMWLYVCSKLNHIDWSFG